MYTEVVQYSAEPSKVTMMTHADGVAEYRLVSDVQHTTDAEGNNIIRAKEVYFEIAGNEPHPTVGEIEADFNSWWERGLKWNPPVMQKRKTTEERLKALEEDSITSLEALAEIYEMLLN